MLRTSGFDHRLVYWKLLRVNRVTVDLRPRNAVQNLDVHLAFGVGDSINLNFAGGQYINRDAIPRHQQYVMVGMRIGIGREVSLSYGEQVVALLTVIKQHVDLHVSIASLILIFLEHHTQFIIIEADTVFVVFGLVVAHGRYGYGVFERNTTAARKECWATTGGYRCGKILVDKITAGTITRRSKDFTFWIP